MRVLVIGGYGVFGGRIISLLETERRLTLIVAGRSLSKAAQFVKARGATLAKLEAAAFDRDADVSAQLAALNVTVAVDASGPFQAYGGDRYRVIAACIERGVHYLDLADGAEFVSGVDALNDAARAAKVFALSGVSSFPVLTAAVVRALAKDMPRVDTIVGGIAPSPFAGVGVNVIRAIASYAGQTIALRRHGAIGKGHPFTEQRRATISPPGRAPLRSTLFSLVDVPDLRVLASVRPEVKDIWMGAGPTPEILHRALVACAWLVRLKFIKSLAPLAPLMHFVMNHVRWGDHRGGMFIVVTGEDSTGAAVTRSWHLIADGDDGPLIPSMAIEAVIRKTLEGKAPAPGARAAVTDLELSDYDALFAHRTIDTGARYVDNTAPLYQRILGPEMAGAPAAVRAMHDVRGPKRASGVAQVQRGRSLLAQIIAAMFGFPKSGDAVPLRVDFTLTPRGERWTRNFPGARFSSRQFAGAGRSEGLLCEQFGPLTFAMAVVVENDSLSLILKRWSAFGIPLPMSLCPRASSREWSEDGSFRVHVTISHPITGLIVQYDCMLDAPVALGEAVQGAAASAEPAPAPARRRA